MCDDLVGRVTAAIYKKSWTPDLLLIRAECKDLARAALASIEAAGYVVVPREPTEAMKVAAREWQGQQSYGDIWHAMINAALEKDKANVG